MEYSPKVSPQVERAQMNERGQEVQQEQTGLRMDFEVALHKSKRNVRQLIQYDFEEMVSYALVIVNGDPCIYEEAMES